MFSRLINSYIMIGEILAGVSALGSLYGSMRSAGANRNVTGFLNKRQSDLDAWYNREYNTNYLDTAEAKSTMQLLREQMRDQMKKVDQNSAIRGASDEARVAMADKLQENVGQNMTRLAGYGTRRKDMISRDYQRQKSYLDVLEAQDLQRKADQWSNFMNNSMNLGIGAAKAAGKGAFDDWDRKLVDLFRKKPSKGVIDAYKARGLF
jgi:hypothetical protein